MKKEISKTIAMFLDKSFPPDVRVENEAYTLIEAGYRVILFVLSYKKIRSYEEINGIEIYRYFGNKLLYKLSALAFTIPFFHKIVEKKTSTFVKKLRPDFLHVHDMVLAPSVLKTSKRFNLPMILDLHENRPAIMKLYSHVNAFPGKYLINLSKWQKAQVMLEKSSDRLILVTEEAKKYAVEIEGIISGKIHVVPNTVRKEFKLKSIMENDIKMRFENKFPVLYFGDTALRRGTDTMLHAIALVKKRIPTIHGIFVGKGSEDHILMEQADKLGIEDHVSFEGWQDVGLLPSYISISYVGICPFKRNLHHDTTYANKLFQFMSFGLPILASDCPAQESIIKKYECGLIFRANDARDLSNKIFKIFNDENQRKQFGKNGEMAITNYLNWEETSKSLLSLYNNY